MSIFRLANAFERSVLSVPSHRPLSQEYFDRLIALSVEPHCISGTAVPEKSEQQRFPSATSKNVSYWELDQIPDFSLYRKVERLELVVKDDPLTQNHYLNILQELCKLTGVKRLELSANGKKAPISPRIRKRIRSLAGLFDRLEELQVFGVEDVTELCPPKMSHLKSLRLTHADWNRLCTLELPSLTSLTLGKVSGITSISEVVQRFPTLRKVSISGSSDECIALGKQLQHLESLRLSNICTVDLDGIANSSLRRLELSDCDLDPTPLQDAAHLEQLIFNRCWLEHPMPTLTQPDLYELSLNDCGIMELEFLQQLSGLQVLSLLDDAIPLSLQEKTDDYPPAFRFLANMPHLLTISMKQSILQDLDRYCTPFARRFQKQNLQWELENKYIAR